MNPLYIFGYIGALAVGISLGLIGGGGSILTVPILVYLFHIEASEYAPAYSLFIVGITALVGGIQKYREGLVDIRTYIVFGIPAIISVYVTRHFIVPAIPDVIHLGNTNVSFSKRLLVMGLFAILMVIASVSMIRGGAGGKDGRDDDDGEGDKKEEDLCCADEEEDETVKLEEDQLIAPYSRREDDDDEGIEIVRKTEIDMLQQNKPDDTNKLELTTPASSQMDGRNHVIASSHIPHDLAAATAADDGTSETELDVGDSTSASNQHKSIELQKGDFRTLNISCPDEEETASLKGHTPTQQQSIQRKFNYPLILVEGFLVGLLTGLVGAGGGFLIIPALVKLGNLPMKVSVGTSLWIIASKSLIGFVGDAQRLDIQWTLLCGVSTLAVGGILIGNYLSRFVSGNDLKRCFGWFVLVMGLSILCRELL